MIAVATNVADSVNMRLISKGYHETRCIDRNVRCFGARRSLPRNFFRRGIATLYIASPLLKDQYAKHPLEQGNIPHAAGAMLRNGAGEISCYLRASKPRDSGTRKTRAKGNP